MVIHRLLKILSTRRHWTSANTTCIWSWAERECPRGCGVIAETQFTVALRQLCWKNATTSQILFSREDPPMIFQYNPLDYIIEQSPEGELVFTIARLANIAPKVRYNLHDRGGVWRHADLKQKLSELGINAESLAKGIASFPILYYEDLDDLFRRWYPKFRSQ